MSWGRLSPASKSKLGGGKFATLMFRWEEQVANDPAMQGQSLALRIVPLIRKAARETDGLADFGQAATARRWGVSREGIRKAIKKLIELGHLELAVSRAREGQRSLFRPLLKGGANSNLGGANSDSARVGTADQSGGHPCQPSVGTESLHPTFSQEELEARRRYLRRELAKYQSERGVAEIERELGAEQFTALAASGYAGAACTLERAELVRLARELPPISAPGPSAGARPDARGKHMALLQLWSGVDPDEAQRTVDAWYASVPHATIGHAFDGASKRTRGAPERARWLRGQIAAAERDPTYRVPTRASHPSDGRAAREIAAVFVAGRAGELTVAEIHRGLPHIERETLRNRLTNMVRGGELERCGYGRYRLSARGAVAGVR